MIRTLIVTLSLLSLAVALPAFAQNAMPGAYERSMQQKASTTWHLCDLIGTVVNQQGTYLVLQDDAGTFDGESWVPVPSDTAKSILATALTAVSMGKQVWVEYDGSQVLTIGLLNSSQ